MSGKSMIRVWQEIDIKEIEPRLLIGGTVSADCGNCKEVGISFDAVTCPKCNQDILVYDLHIRSVRYLSTECQYRERMNHEQYSERFKERDEELAYKLAFPRTIS